MQVGLEGLRERDEMASAKGSVLDRVVLTAVLSASRE